MRILGHDGDHCRAATLENFSGEETIVRSVGAGGVNQASDVRVIQRLLNRIAPTHGGPAIALVPDGIVGPKTLAAIDGFQRFHQTASDRRVDPGGPTLTRLRETPKVPRGVAEAGRLARAVQAMPALIGAARAGLAAAERAGDHLRLGGGLGLIGDREWRLARFYFALEDDAVARGALDFIARTFHRVATVLESPPSPVTGGSAFGVAIFDVDPEDINRTIAGPPFRMYTPTGRANGPAHSGHVYICDAADAMAPDFFAYVLFHELFHFIDDETEQTRIYDEPHGYRAGALRLSHEQRMHNADNYALFGWHAAVGRAALIATVPDIAPHVPAELAP